MNEDRTGADQGTGPVVPGRALMPERVIATAKVKALVRRIREEFGPLIFHQSGGCCEGTAPMCFRQSDFRVGANDVFLGVLEDCPFYIGAATFRYFSNTQLVIDLTEGGGDSFSLEASEGVRFITRSRLFTDQEARVLDAQGPPPKGVDAACNMRSTSRSSTMKAFVYQGPGKSALMDRPKPGITAPTDAIVKVVKTTICGTDLHILKGDVPTCTPGRILGHEGVGIVEEVGAAVTAFKPGDRVIVSCISACGKCDYCRKGMYSHCTTGGWILGNKIDGTQAEYVRTPHADTSLYHIPAGLDEEALVMLSDILPTGFECGVLNGKVQPGSTVAIVGSGPIGLAALLTAQFYSPAQIIMIDFDDNRLEFARKFGATAVVNASDGKAVETVMRMTGGRGVDTAIEAVGVPASFITCEDIVAPGGIIANIGVHGVKVDLHLEKLWDRNIAITTRLVDTAATPMLLKTVASHKVDPARLITHHFKLDKIMDAYDTFSQAAKTNALKVIIET